MFRTITDVVRAGLCSGCGVCAALCPMEAISMVEDVESGVYQPVRDAETCSMCNRCVHVCAGHGLEMTEARI
ncbi:MAG: 4Fe-4S dicluster domain-containing protein, partial [Chloroflexota bacterium]